MASSSDSLFRMYGSADWICSTDKFENEILTFIEKGENDVIKSVFSVKKNIKEIHIFNYKFIKIFFVLNCVDLISSEPLGNFKEKLSIEIFNEIFDYFKNLSCLYIKSINPESVKLTIINDCLSTKKSKYFICKGSPIRSFHYITLGESFDQYLSKFSKKERYNLKRQCRVAQKYCGDKLELKRIDESKWVDFFVNCSRKILKKSWKVDLGEENEFFSDKCTLKYLEISRKGLLRSYVLLGGDEPWAFVLGFQWDGVFHYSNIAYDKEKFNLSPGAVLFYLMLEDLYMYNKPNYLNFGIGNSFYKNRFGTDIDSDCTVLILKKNIKNFMLSLCLKTIFLIKSKINKVKI